MEQKHFSKSLGITAGILIPLCLVVLGAYFFIQKSKEVKPWKPEKEIYDLNETINYGPITISNMSFVSPYSDISKEELQHVIDENNKGLISESKSDNKYKGVFVNNKIKNMNACEELKTQLSAVKLTIKNSYENKNEIVTNNSQYIIKDGDKVIKPHIINYLGDIGLQLDELNWSINRALKSGEETTGIIFFKETNFQNPVLEINPINGSYPIKIKLY